MNEVPEHKKSKSKTWSRIGILTIILLILITIFSFTSLILLRTQFIIKNFQVTNLTGKSVTISWETNEPLATQLRFKKGSDLELTERISFIELKDDRDNSESTSPRYTHIVTLKDLEPNTKYYFNIGNEIIPVNIPLNSFTTYSISERIENPQPIYGQINLASGGADYSDILIHYLIYDPKSGLFSNIYSTLPNSEGRWSGEIFSIRDKIGANYFTKETIAAIFQETYALDINQVLGETTESIESFSENNGEVAEFVEVIATNGKVLDTSYIPLTASISNEIITSYIDDTVFKKIEFQAPDLAMAPAVYCDLYQSYPLNSCTNTQCPSARNCAMQALQNRAAAKCLSRSSTDQILDCCAAGATIQNGACVSPGYCSNYGTFPLNSCTNTQCPTGRNCQPNSLTNADVKKCVARSNSDQIADCCAAGATIQNGACVSPEYCSNYGTFPLNSCTNTQCPTGRNCQPNSLTNAAVKKCVARSGNDVIADCCAAGATIQNGACVSPGYCSNYGSFPLNSCTNTQCPTGRNCQPNSLTNAAVVKCVARSGNDVIADCCAAGATIQNGACVSPGYCSNYGTFPLNSCTNTQCPTGRNCQPNSLTNAAVVKCVARSNSDQIADCCAAGATIQNGACTNTTGSCNNYGSFPLNSCTNTACPSGRNCAANSLTNAAAVKCLNRHSADEIVDCCPANHIIQNNTCVAVNPSVSTSVTITTTVSVTPTAVPQNLNGCVTLSGTNKAQIQAQGQQLINEKIVPFIARESGYAPIQITFQISGTGAECSTGPSHVISCGLPGDGAIWLTSKLIFHEVMHNFKSVYAPGTVDKGTSELMASIMEGYYTRESCMGGEYTYYGLGDPNREHGRKPDLIRSNSGLSAQQLWNFAITGQTAMFTNTVVNRIIPGAWKYRHIYCVGFKQWSTYYEGPGCEGDQLANISNTFDVNMDIVLSPAKLNDYNAGLYRLDLSYKTLTNAQNEADKTIPVKLLSQPGCAAGSPSCAVNDVLLGDVYVDPNAPNDEWYDLKVTLNSDVKNDLNCWNTRKDLGDAPPPTSPIDMNLNLEDMKCDYSFGGIPIGGTCNTPDIAATGIVAPWQNISGASQSQSHSSSHPGVDVTASEGSNLVSAADGVVVYTRRGNVKDSIYFDQVKYGTKCEEGSRLNPDNWLCVCDWCPMEKVTDGASKRPDLCNQQRDCVARAQQLQNSSPDWVSEGALHRIYGNLVIIEHQNHRTIYAHLKNISVSPGDCVTAGQAIGSLGTSGSSSGPHVHFEVRTISGTIINPSSFPCTGSGCNLMALFTPKNYMGYANLLGLNTEDHPDFTDGDIVLLDNQTSKLAKGIYQLSAPVSGSNLLAAKQDDLTPRLFLDKNKNKTLDEGDTTLGSTKLNIEFKQVGGLQDIKLNTNWNLVSFNSLATNSTTTKDLAQIADLSGLNLEMASYESDKWVISALKEEGNVTTFYGNEYNLIPGRAFFIKTSPSGTYYHTGEMFTNINKELELQIGWNFFSFSSDVIDSTKPTSYSLLEKCKAAQIGCTLFADYNGQLDNIVLAKEIFYGKDYPLAANKGYVMKVDNNPGIVRL